MIVIATLVFSLIINLGLSSENIQKTLSGIESENLFAQFIRAENHIFFASEEVFTIPPISEILFELATNIKPRDTRSFLGNELPGLNFYDTEIVVAGEGTDLSTLPYESAPPLEVLLKEKEVIEEELQNNTGIEDQKPLLNKEPNVFVYHTHNLESFLPLLKNASRSNEAVSSDERANVVALGKRLNQKLIGAGIGVEHNKTNINKELLERKWDYSASYKLSNEVIQEAVAENKNLKYFIDIHRDSARKDVTTKVIDGKSYAKLYFIVGKENDNYEENLEFVKKINTELEKRFPGISRGVFLKNRLDGNGVYNQDVSNRALLVEIGGVDNTLDELGRTTDAFADVFSDIYWEEYGGKKE
ncbi:stage II sporulation protein P [Bacillus sp. 7894-2]|nr:stage II sporulation protein P [Bacillus sp. 7894-2]